jgi:hypothetical protein
MRVHRIWFALLVSIIAALTGGCSNATKLSYEAKTYHYSEAGIEFQYPAHLIARDEYSNGSYYVTLSEQDASLATGGITFFNGNKPKDMEFINKNILGDEELMSTVVKDETIIIDHKEARQLCVEEMIDGKRMLNYYIIVETDEMSLLIMSGAKEEDSPAIPVFFEMLSTIKFSDSTSFNYSQFGIEFQYPKQWIINSVTFSGTFLVQLSNDNQEMVGDKQNTKIYGFKPKNMKFSNELISMAQNDGAKIIEDKKITIHNVEARQVCLERIQDGKSMITYHIIVDNHETSLVVVSNEMDRDNHNFDLFFDMIASLKFSQ